MANIQQIAKELKKSFSTFDLAKAVENSDNEAKTRMYLVEPFFEILRFNRGFDNGNLVPEYDADFANLKGKKVDYAILTKGKPEILVEVKSIIDESILGGFILRIGDLQYNASVANQLNKLKREFTLN